MTTLSLAKSNRIYWASGIVSICGIIFEVLFGALGSYILGDGVKQYTLTISLFLTGMGIGAAMSERVMKRLIQTFILIECFIAMIGGFSALLMFGMTAYASAGADALFLYSVILTVGLLTGLELPILIRKANEIGVEMNKSAARVLFSDYAGGLIGGLLFVFLLRPQLGLVKTAFVVGIVNALVALWMVVTFREELKAHRRYVAMTVTIVLLLIGGVLFGEEAAFSFEQRLYEDPIIFSEDTEYQRIIFTKEQGDTRLYLDGQLQFSSSDEHRYHETLVHPAMAAAENRSHVLILGGGDGIAAKEVLKYKEVKKITLVDLDPRMTELANEYPELLRLNEGALKNDKVTVINEDAFQFLEKSKEWYDIVLVDLPDPNNESLNKLYTWEFYSLIRNHLAPNGVIMVQATSPVFAPEVYWTIDKTVEEAGFRTENLHVDIPSFGNWGFVLAARQTIDISSLHFDVDTEYLTPELLPALTAFGKDEDGKIVDRNGRMIMLEANTLIHPHLVEKYERAWRYY